MDTLVVGGTVVTEHAASRATIGILNGAIAAVYAPDAPLPPAAEIIDASGLLVMPGAVDAHTHFTGVHDRPDEGVRLGTRAAALGGITTVLEHPQSDPPATTVERFLAKRRLLEANTAIDFGLWAGITAETLDALPGLAAAGAVAFKGFMCSTNPSGVASDPKGLPQLTDGVLLEAMRAIAAVDSLVGLHAENHAILNHLTARLQAEGRHDPRAHAQASPIIGEVEAVARALLLAEEAGVRCHIVHLTSSPAAAVVQTAKARGRVSMETCPHYLTLDEDDLVRLGPYGRCSPPLRIRSEVEALWAFIADGSIDSLASDHCPYFREQKEPGRESIWRAALGLTGVQTLGPLFFSEAVMRRGLPLTTFARLTAAGPARLFGLYPRKGTIAPGADADIAFYDPTIEWSVRESDLVEPGRWSPFEGWTIRGQVKRVMVRGTTVLLDGQIRVNPGFGRFIDPSGRSTHAVDSLSR